MDVKRILARKGRDVHTIEGTATITAALSALAQQCIGALVVLGTDGGIRGIISERDIVRAVEHKGTAALASPVAAFMTSNVVTCSEGATDIEIMKLMTERAFRHVPVTACGHVSGIVSIGDVVKVRVEELESKLMSLEAITASIAHEVRQPLAAIATSGSAALRFLGHTPPNNDEVRAALNRIIADAHRTSKVFDSIRALFRQSDEGRQLLAVNELIAEVVPSLNGELKERNIETTFNLAADLPLVRAHADQLNQVMHNLVRNAMEAMSTTTGVPRKLTIETSCRGGESVAIALIDSGPGIRPQQLDKIFDTFVTTKSTGMGLGLAICRMIIERHGGQLTAASDGKSGATLQIALPAGHAIDAAE
jgi:signal transduction histidine kinase